MIIHVNRPKSLCSWLTVHSQRYIRLIIYWLLRKAADYLKRGFLSEIHNIVILSCRRSSSFCQVWRAPWVEIVFVRVVAADALLIFGILSLKPRVPVVVKQWETSTSLCILFNNLDLVNRTCHSLIYFFVSLLILALLEELLETIFEMTETPVFVDQQFFVVLLCLFCIETLIASFGRACID